MREKILTFIEKNSRIDIRELAIVLGVDEACGFENWKLWSGAYHLRLSYVDQLG